jgi:hypothetical protein
MSKGYIIISHSCPFWRTCHFFWTGCGNTLQPGDMQIYPLTVIQTFLVLQGNTKVTPPIIYWLIKKMDWLLIDGIVSGTQKANAENLRYIISANCPNIYCEIHIGIASQDQYNLKGLVKIYNLSQIRPSNRVEDLKYVFDCIHGSHVNTQVEIPKWIVLSDICYV